MGRKKRKKKTLGPGVWTPSNLEEKIDFRKRWNPARALKWARERIDEDIKNLSDKERTRILNNLWLLASAEAFTWNCLEESVRLEFEISPYKRISSKTTKKQHFEKNIRKTFLRDRLCDQIEKTIPNTPFVYAVFRMRPFRVAYIGQARSINRIRSADQGHSNLHEAMIECTRLAVFSVESKSLAEQLEASLIECCRVIALRQRRADAAYQQRFSRRIAAYLALAEEPDTNDYPLFNTRVERNRIPRLWSIEDFPPY